MVMNLDDVVTLDPDQAYETTNLMIHNSTYDTLVEYKAGDLTKAMIAKYGEAECTKDEPPDFLEIP